MKGIVFSLTPQGERIAEKLNKIFGWKTENKDNFKKKVESAFYQYDALIFVMASGIVVRTIAPLIQNKTKDPAIIVIDQQGRYVISLMSGHIGGANKLALQIADSLNAQPVITTATDIENKISFDIFAKENNLKIENIENLKYISSAVLSDTDVGLISDHQIYKDKMPEYIITENAENIAYKVVISDRILNFEDNNKNVLFLRPQTLVVGIGCKKNIDSTYLEECFIDILKKQNLSLMSVFAISTIDIKSNEKAILDLCRKYSIRLEIADNEKILKSAEKFEKSEFVKEVTGVPSVAEGSAYVISENGEKICGKVRYKGVTLAVFRKNLNIN
jgi:cobalt-precorrin 5A hydrolase